MTRKSRLSALGMDETMNKQQFTQQVLEAEQSLYHVAHTLLVNEEDCADAIQNAILTAYDKLDDLKKDAYFKTWLTRILINECYRIFRMDRHHFSYETLEQEQGLQIPGNPSCQPECRVLEQDDEVYRAVLQLEPAYRMPFVLYYVEGYSVKEVAQILKVSDGTVKTRMHRARKQLREILQEKAEEKGGNRL